MYRELVDIYRNDGPRASVIVPILASQIALERENKLL